MKDELLAWVAHNRELLSRHTLYATGRTGRILEDALNIDIHKLQSGPLGGDQQLGAKISEGEIEFLMPARDTGPPSSASADEPLPRVGRESEEKK
jgi:methylglyoxal synthase